MTIGAVLARLRPDFPDITISKIRFLEAEGLVSPRRTPSGYRTFDDADVERLRYILAAQRDRYWPLKVIREALDAMDRGLEPAVGEQVVAAQATRVPQAPQDPQVPTVEELGRPVPRLRLTRSELGREAGLDPAFLDALCTYGLVRPGPDGHFTGSALAIARAASGLAAFGLEPRHLRMFRTAADREVGLVQQVLPPRRGQEGDDAAAELLHHCIGLHVALVKDSLRR